METLNIVELLILWSAIGILLAVTLADSTLDRTRPLFNIYVCFTIFGPLVFCASLVYYIVINPIVRLIRKYKNKY